MRDFSVIQNIYLLFALWFEKNCAKKQSIQSYVLIFLQDFHFNQVVVRDNWSWGGRGFVVFFFKWHKGNCEWIPQEYFSSCAALLLIWKQRIFGKFHSTDCLESYWHQIVLALGVFALQNAPRVRATPISLFHPEGEAVFLTLRLKTKSRSCASALTNPSVWN